MWHESKLNGWPWCHVSPSSQICVMGYYSGTKHTWTKTEYLSYLQFGVPPRAREEESKQRALRDYREGNIPPLFPLPSCVRMTQLFSPFFFFTPALPPSTLSLAVSALGAHNLVRRHDCYLRDVWRFSVMQSSQQRKKKEKMKKPVGQLSPKNELRKIIRNELGVWVSGKTSISEQP